MASTSKDLINFNENKSKTKKDTQIDDLQLKMLDEFVKTTKTDITTKKTIDNEEFNKFFEKFENLATKNHFTRQSNDLHICKKTTDNNTLPLFDGRVDFHQQEKLTIDQMLDVNDVKLNRPKNDNSTQTDHKNNVIIVNVYNYGKSNDITSKFENPNSKTDKSDNATANFVNNDETGSSKAKIANLLDFGEILSSDRLKMEDMTESFDNVSGFDILTENTKVIKPDIEKIISQITDFDEDLIDELISAKTIEKNYLDSKKAASKNILQKNEKFGRQKSCDNFDNQKRCTNSDGNKPNKIDFNVKRTNIDGNNHTYLDIMDQIIYKNDQKTNENKNKNLNKDLEDIKNLNYSETKKKSTNNFEPKNKDIFEEILSKNDIKIKSNLDMNTSDKSQIKFIAELITKHNYTYLEPKKKVDKLFKKHSILKNELEKESLTLGPTLYEKAVALPKMMERFKLKKQRSEQKGTRKFIVDSSRSDENLNNDGGLKSSLDSSKSGLKFNTSNMKLCLSNSGAKSVANNAGFQENCGQKNLDLPSNKKTLNDLGTTKILMADCNRERLIAYETGKLFQNFVRTGNYFP